MPRRRGSRKSTKLTPGVLFFVLGIGLIGSIIHKSENVAVQTLPSSPVNDPASRASSETRVELAPASVPVAPSQESESSEPSRAASVTRFIKGRKVALRDGPGKQYGILDRFDSGRELRVIEAQGDWSKIQDVLTQREGWISTVLLSEQKPTEKQQPTDKGTSPASDDKPPPPSIPQISDSLVIQRIIAESISMYPGSCACPYNTDRGGRRCGKRSAYNRGGGYAPICFAGDVSKQMIQSFREQASR
ncbi:SH3 domain-containing protein [Rhizobium sp. 268]|uniref:SH3 domain-containing protein n=1 Tax=Rhizobium sp. 268 TaxID=2996375 RepID=UPI003FA7D0A2